MQRWCASGRLQLNADKTEFIWIGSAVNLECLQTDPVGLTIADVNVKAVDCVVDLGIHLDSQLDLRTHISRIVSTCYFHLRRMRHLRHIVSHETQQCLVSALILSRIDYGNVIFAGLPQVTLAPLRRVMNAAVHFVMGLCPRDHVTAAWHELHWLPSDQCIIYKLCILMHADLLT